MNKKVSRFINLLTSVQLPNVFNPYAECCNIYDRIDASGIRRKNIEEYLTRTLELRINTVWFGRDLGYRGGRRTGVALTDEIHLPMMANILGTAKITQATTSKAVSERTATIVWSMVQEIGYLPFFWNAFPFHPYEAGNPLSNRPHSRDELRLIWNINLELLELIQPQKIIAIGKDAHDVLSREGIDCLYVRHPSYGGQADFIAGLRRIHRQI